MSPANSGDVDMLRCRLSRGCDGWLDSSSGARSTCSFVVLERVEKSAAKISRCLAVTTLPAGSWGRPPAMSP